MKKISLADILDDVFTGIDITPTQYKKAVSHYNAVSEYLFKGKVGNDIYPQGSFALGTVVRPYREGKDADYDIDIVCQSDKTKEESGPKEIKQQVKDCLLTSQVYSKLLNKKEGRKCWTLNYAKDSSGVGFHLDILPCICEEQSDINRIVLEGVDPHYAEHAIAITDKNFDSGLYHWSTGNARGYANWFWDINASYLDVVSYRQKDYLVLENHYDSIEDVPELLLRSPLQRVIQLLKRHRDCRFSGMKNESDKPISIIITTLATRIAESRVNYNISAVELLSIVIDEITQRNTLLQDNFHQYNRNVSAFFTRTDRGWNIPNPVNPEENFANRWGENNNAKAKAFFQWVSWLKEDLLIIDKESGAVFEKLQQCLGKDLIKDVYSKKKLNPYQSPNIFNSTKDTPKPYGI